MRKFVSAVYVNCSTGRIFTGDWPLLFTMFQLPFRQCIKH